MKAKVLFIIFYTALIYACDDKNNGSDNGAEPELAKINIGDARALYLAGFSSAATANNEEGKLFKINEAGAVDEVSFLDQNGEELNASVLNLWKVSDEYILLSANIKTENGGITDVTLFGDVWLVRKRDGAVFDVGDMAQALIMNLKIKPSTLLVDQSGRLYWRGIQDMGGLPGLKGPLYQLSSLNEGNLTATSISGDFETIGWCYIDNQDVILMGADNEWIYRFPNGTFVKDTELSYDTYMQGWYCVPIRESANGGFICLEYSNPMTRIYRITPDIANNKIVHTEIAAVDVYRDFLSRDDMPDGSCVLYTSDYKDYIYVSPSGAIEVKTYETGFMYDNKRVSNNCVYGIEGSTIFRMNFDTRITDQVFSDSRFKIDDYDVSPDDSYIDIFALRYSDARKVVLRIQNGQIISENTQSENVGEVITFIRLN